MFRLLVQVQAVLNRAKEERSTNDETAQPLNAALKAAAEVDVVKLPMSKTFVAPLAPPKKRSSPSKVVSVQYDAPRQDMDRVMEALDVDSARQAGLRTFQYFINAELD
jgi:hypothetical protein